MQVTVKAQAPSSVTVNFGNYDRVIENDAQVARGETEEIAITARRKIATITISENRCVIAGNYSKTFTIDQCMRCHFVDPASMTQWLVLATRVEGVFEVSVRCLPQHPHTTSLYDLPAPTIDRDFVNIFQVVKSTLGHARLFVVYSRTTGDNGMFSLGKLVAFHLLYLMIKQLSHLI